MEPSRPPVPRPFLLLDQLLGSVLSFHAIGLGISGGLRGGSLQAIHTFMMGSQLCGQRMWLRDGRIHFILIFTVSLECQDLGLVGGSGALQTTVQCHL